MNNVQHQADYEAQEQHGYTDRVELERTLQSLVAVVGNKGIQAGTAEDGGLTTGGSRRVAGAKQAADFELVVNNIAFVNVARVVSAGASCCPGADLFAADNEGQRVSSVDVVNSVPSDADFASRISHYDTFVEDFELGPQEDEPCCAAGECAPGQTCQDFLSASEDQKRCNGEDCQCKNDASENKSADWSESQSITHKSIFAGGVAVLSITQQEKI